MRRRGTAAVLAMIFLVVFSALTAAFYTMTTTSVQVARNDRNSQRALAAAESGAALIQRVVADVRLGQKDIGTTVVTAKIFAGLQDKLKSQIAGASIDSGGSSFTLPAITLHAKKDSSFVATIEVLDTEVNLDRPGFVLTVTGTDVLSQLKRTLTVNLVARNRSAEVFKYGMAARGLASLGKEKSNIIGEPKSAGSIISAFPGDYAIYSNGAWITGDVFVAGDPSTAFVYDSSSGAIGNVSITENEALALEHVHQVDPPEFPEFTPNDYDNIVGLTTLSGIDNSKQTAGTVYKDVRITGDVSFGANDVLQGLIYVEPGATVSFTGNPTIQGVIVVEDPPGETTSTSRLFFHGVPVFQQPVWDATSVVSPEAQAALSGYSILGPTAYVYVTGSGGGNKSPANAGFARTVVCGTLMEDGSGIINIYDGTLITMADTYLTGAQAYSSCLEGDGIRITKSDSYQFPMGGYKQEYSWVIDSTTYDEKQ